MRTLRWMIPAAGIVFLSLVGCKDDGYEQGSDTTVIEDQEPDVIIEQDDEGIEAEIDIEDGKVEGEVKVED